MAVLSYVTYNDGVCAQPDVLNYGDDAEGYLDEYAKVRLLLVVDLKTCIALIIRCV